MTALLFALALFAQEDKRVEARRLEEKALQAELEKERHRFLAEAWALRSEAFAEEGNFDASYEAWLKARGYGWTGPRPSGRSGREGTTLQDEDNPLGVPKPIPPKERTMWEHMAYQPYTSGRNGIGGSLVHIPPFEEAVIYPTGTWHARLTMEYSLETHTERTGGGKSNWETALLLQLAEIEYSITRNLQIGVRFTTGELFETDDDIVIFQNNIQIVFSGNREFNLESIAPRIKFVVPIGVVDFGALLEFKIPIAGEDDFLTADTFDLALSGLITVRLGEDWAIHANLGATFTFSDTELFRDSDDFATLPDTNEIGTVFHYALGVTYRLFTDFSVGLQLTGNGPVFSEIDFLDDGNLTVAAHCRYEMDYYAFFSVAIGLGIGDLSDDVYLSFAFDFVF